MWQSQWWFGSVGSTALKGVEQHVPHGADVGLDPVEAVAIGLAVLAALPVDPVPVGDQFPVEAVQQGLVGEVSVMIKRGFRSIFDHHAGASLRR